jgi:hypothetical protein
MMAGAVPHPKLVLAQDLTVTEWIVERIHEFAVQN